MPNGAFAKINVGFHFWKKQIKTTQKYWTQHKNFDGSILHVKVTAVQNNTK